MMPTMVLFAKITPESIEATCFAFLTGTLNFCRSVVSPQIGNFINTNFVGVKGDDLSQFYILCLISLAGSIIPFAFLHMVPLKEDIKKLQDDRKTKSELKTD